MLTYDSATATFRGSPSEIDELARQLTVDDAVSVLARLRDDGAEMPEGTGDDLLASIGVTLSSSLFTVELTVSGPSGHQRHVIDAGQNAVGVRLSPLTDDLSELNGFPVVNLPGGMTRLVRFLPGMPPAADAEAIRVRTSAVVDLGAPETSVRRSAWVEVQPHLAEAGYQADGASSWQLTRSRAEWISMDGEESSNLAVYLRVATQYFVVVETDDGVDLVPVPSVTAWETMMQVLPGANEVGRPS
ncbi:hypothetical protein [Brachybacterium fresconis]|uniref:ESX secretion-associated protein EspG n=1 Tax=Brachybacterium fresconis TaxID=173363 RepID=A0ABS4YMM4_9MICO|nr:hypothetical protein [Brachybacterium fresconis]MBP2410043.1 hypothetical protein [Brachybacterium fresconis]